MLGEHPLIFASVGSMLPFDRFVQAVDEWARDNPLQEVFIQIGGGAYEPLHAPFARMVPLVEYRRRLNDCDLFIAHVGMGSILQAMEARKQMLLMVRDYNRGEHTTDHQAATAKRFRGKSGLCIVDTEDALKASITELLRTPLTSSGSFSTKASPQLLNAVATYLRGGTPDPIITG